MEITLTDIFVGKANGLEEAADAQFENLFYKGNQKYKQLAENTDKFIITGRKGTGKTILAKYYEHELKKNDVLVRMLTSREVVLKCFLEKGSSNLDRREAELFIEYTILCEIAQIILDNKWKLFNIDYLFSSIKILKALNTLKEFVEKRNEAANFSLDTIKTIYETSCDTSGNLEHGCDNIKTGYESAVSYSDQIEKNYKKSPYYQIIDTLKKNILYLLPKIPVTIIFDDLDEFDDRIDNNKNFIKFLNTFIEKSHELNVDFRNGNCPNSRIIILLRSDIIKVLNGESSNLNKIMADSEIRLNWIKKTAKSDLHPLMDLIGTKIKNSHPGLKDLSAKEVINRFFPEQINGIPVIDHMLNCSFGRPRDIINMLNIIRELYPTATAFTADHFKATQLEYSIKFIDELRNEMASHFEAEKTEECFSIIKAIGKKTFWLSDVKALFEQQAADFKYFDKPQDFLTLAYDFGIIGNTWLNSNPDSNKKYGFSWKYREDGIDIPDYSKKFSVHLALRKSLLP